MIKLVYGVGINDADYVQQMEEVVDGKRKLVWICPFYKTWRSMLERSYSKKYKLKRPTYEHVSVCKEWHLFSTFKSWMQEQDWEGNQLDKDLLVSGNRVYSPEACVFVSGQVNNFMINSGATRGGYRIGVCWNKQRGKFVAQCRDPFAGIGRYLGYFPTENEAHEAWLAKKLEHAHALAAIQTDERVANALIDRYENYNEMELKNE
jgi:hypothetical protein